MNAKMKLVQSTQVARLGSEQPDLQPASLLPQNPATLGILGRGKLEHLQRRETLKIEQEKMRDSADAQIHLNRLKIQAVVLVEGERIAYRSALARQELTAACVRLTAQAISTLENERVDRTNACFAALTARETKLQADAAEGRISCAYLEYLREDVLESAVWLKDRDTRQTRAIADRIGDIHEFAALGFASREDKP